MQLLSAFKLYLLKIFDLKEDELNKTLLLQLNIFIIISVLLIIKPTVNSLFLSELTASAIPLGYVLTALVAVFGSFFYNAAQEKYAINIIMRRTLIGSIISLIVFAVVFKFKLASGYILYIPYTWVAIFGLLTASQFWILANLSYNAREAKRVFGFIGAGAIAGAIFGGYLTSVLTSFLTTEDLFFVAALLLSACIPITHFIWKNEVVKLNVFQISMRSVPKGESSFKLIKQSKLLTLIATVIGLGVLVAKLVDYQYSDYASRFISDQDELTAFFGFWFSTLSVISLLIQLFLTKRLVGTFGVGKSLLWLPSGILIVSVLLLIVPQLWVVVLIKIIDGSLKQSVNKAATELLSIPIPIEIKKKTKTFTDVVIDSVATGLAGFILIFFINGLEISSTYVSLIIICLIMVWLYFIYHLRQEYITAFKGLLEVPSKKENNKQKQTVEVTSIINTVIRVLKTGSEGQITHMLQKTLENSNEHFFHPIKALLNHPSAKIRALAIENLYFLKTEKLTQIMEQMIFDDDQEVTTAAFKYLLKHSSKDPVPLFEKFLNHEDKTIKNASLVSLATELRNHQSLQQKFNLEQKIENAIKEYETMPEGVAKTFKIQAILEAIGKARVSRFYNIIESHFNYKKPEVINTAILSASYSLDGRFINAIITFLSIKEHRPYAIEALRFYNEPIIKVLFDYIKNETISHENAVFCLAVIESFASQKAINCLIKLTENTEHTIKIRAIEALKRLKWKHPHLIIKDRFVVDKILDECNLYEDTLSVIHSQIVIKYKKKSSNPDAKEENEARNALISLLEQRLDRQLERMFSFLGIKYPPNDVEPVFNTIIRGKEEQRIHAIEFLDNILNKELKKELIPVAESVLYDVNSEERIKLLNLKTLSEVECYNALLKRKDQRLKMAVLHLIEKTNDRKFVPILESIVLNDSDDKTKNRAAYILKKL